MPDDIKRQDFVYSMQMGMNIGSDDENEAEDESFFRRIVISPDTMFSQCWRVIYIFSCLTSSYFYAYISAFGVPVHPEPLWYINMIYEGIFLISLLLNFITAYKPQGDMSKPVKNINMISTRYFKGNFIFDFLPLIPFADIIVFDSGIQRLFYLIKLMRFFTGFNVISNMQNIMYFPIQYYKKKIERIIRTDAYLANNTEIDNNNITTLMIIRYLMKIVRLVLIIMNISFFLGLFWWIICDLIRMIKLSANPDYYKQNAAVYNIENFINYNDLDTNNSGFNTVVLMYYAFTSLSTVGFGDYHPRSDEERGICAIILLLGVAIFSYFMSILFEIIDSFGKLNDPIDEGVELTRFFGLIRKFNNNAPID